MCAAKDAASPSPIKKQGFMFAVKFFIVFIFWVASLIRWVPLRGSPDVESMAETVMPQNTKNPAVWHR
jgi:hypothetical protein